MKVETTRFGPLEIADDEVVQFPEGLIGFENCTRYAIVDRQQDKPVWWLQSLDLPAVAFILTDPADVVPQYRPQIGPTELEELGLSSLEEAELHVMLVVAKQTKTITANLLGPLVINPHTRVGKQVVLYNSGYSPAHRLIQPAAAGTPRGDAEGGEPRC
jgi:flagellar assembly factor FliW